MLLYTSFGRKKIKSGIASHEAICVLSAVSDVNLLAAIEMNQWIKKVNMPARIFALFMILFLQSVR